MTEAATITIQNLDGRSEQCDLKFAVSHESVVMKSDSPTLGKQVWNGRDAFHALELFRRKSNRLVGELYAMALENMPIRPACAETWAEDSCSTQFPPKAPQI